MRGEGTGCTSDGPSRDSGGGGFPVLGEYGVSSGRQITGGTGRRSAFYPL